MCKKIDFYNNFADCKGTLGLDDIAQLFGSDHTQESVAKILREDKFFKWETTPYKKFRNNGYVVVKLKVLEGPKKVVIVPRFTPKGVLYVVDRVLSYVEGDSDAA